MSAARDPLARRLAAAALAISLVALVLAAWGAWQAEHHLRDLRNAVERAVQTRQGPSLGPRPSFDTED